MWVFVALFAAGCSSDPGDVFPTVQPDARDAQSDAQMTGSGGAAGASPDSGTEAGGGGAGGSAGSSAEPDAQVDTYIAPDAGQDALSTDATDAQPEPDAQPDAGADAPDARIDSAPNDSGAPDAIDAERDVLDARVGDGAVAPDANDGGLPPSCDYVIEAVYPATLCGVTMPSLNGTYQFSQIRFRQPFSNPTPYPPFAGGTMTVRNGANVATYDGQMWATTMGEEVIFRGPGGAAIVFTTGVQEISVTTRDTAGKVGCLPQPCTWTVTQ
jgi:hypothetical protein